MTIYSVILDMSSVSEYEKIIICANYRYLLDKESYNCEYKWKDYQERTKKSWEDTKKFFKENKGCFGGSTKTFRKIHSDKSIVDNSVVVLGYQFKDCLCNYRNQSINYYLTLYDKYEKFGLLPFEGPITEQPAKIMDIFNIIESVKLEYNYQKNNK